MLTEVLDAVRTPEDHAQAHTDPDVAELARLAGAASLGVAGWGGMIHWYDGVGSALRGALHAVTVAGVSWGLAIPALVVMSSMVGSKLPTVRLLHASLMTVAFGGLAFLASVPVVGLVDLVYDHSVFARQASNTLCVLGVGACSAFIFFRITDEIEHLRALHIAWMGLFGTLFLEIAYLTDLFRFTGGAL
jgi:hypothetical protein